MKKAVIYTVLVVLILVFNLPSNANAQGVYGCEWHDPLGICVPSSHTIIGCDPGYQPPIDCTSLSKSECNLDETIAPCVSDGDEITSPGDEITSPGDEVEGGSVSIKNPLKYDTIEGILGGVGSFLFTVSISLATIIVLYGAFQLLTSAGRPERVEKGKKTILWAVIGIVVLLVAGGVTSIIRSIIGG